MIATLISYKHDFSGYHSGTWTFSMAPHWLEAVVQSLSLGFKALAQQSLKTPTGLHPTSPHVWLQPNWKFTWSLLTSVPLSRPFLLVGVFSTLFFFNSKSYTAFNTLTLKFLLSPKACPNSFYPMVLFSSFMLFVIIISFPCYAIFYFRMPMP